MSEHLSVTLKERRSFPPSGEFSRQANIGPWQYGSVVREGREKPQEYWARAAGELDWFRPWERVLEWNAPVARWFVGGRLNASYNCLDRHLVTQPHKIAIAWEGEPGECVTWTYSELHYQVEKCTAALRKLGLRSGDRVAIYMPMIPEAVVAMLACARGGFTHTVVFGGFSAEALKDRIQDAQARAILTADGSYRKGAWLKLQEQVDAAVGHCSSVEFVVSVKRSQAGTFNRYGSASAQSGAASASASSSAAPAGRLRTHDWHELLAGVTHQERLEQGKAAELDSEHPLFILYTSGTTGKPKGIVHTTKTVFDLKPTDLYWCTADIGWVTGHSYVVYGPLAAGASVFLYEGAPTTPSADRFWAMIERHRINILYTAPTAIRAFMKLGTEPPRGRDLSSLRLLGTVGEPINPEAWIWYRENIGGGRCPIVDTYWQTETGAIVISPLPGVTATKPGSATLPLPGYDVEVVDKKGQPVPLGSGGYLVIRQPWPAMARTIHGDPERFKKQYWSEFPGGIYFTGDGARKDEDGYIWCLGRVDDVLNVSGHRLGTMEVESALVSHPLVAEAAVVGRPDELKGQAVVAFVTLKAEASQGLSPQAMEECVATLRAHVVKEIGALARPEEIRLTEALPKTRSGKIMRRLLRELASTGQVKGDTTTLEDFSVIQSLQLGSEED